MLALHAPVLIDPLLEYAAPIKGVWIDGTFGAGGYTRRLLAAGASRVIGIDRDPFVHEDAKSWIDGYDGRIALFSGVFGDLDKIAETAGFPLVDGVVLDIGVSSMQIDQAERGFSFQKTGPLDMRMEQAGPSAADIVNTADETMLADILYVYGEERASFRIARKIIEERQKQPITTTAELAKIIESVLPRAKPGQSHPATRSFQALRIAVNDEFGELSRGLSAAERVLKPGGILAVVTFHSLEDRIVKKFLQLRSGNAPSANRYMPEQDAQQPGFELIKRGAVSADATEVEENPRARSAKLRLARRLDTAPLSLSDREIAVPHLPEKSGRKKR